MERTKRRSIFCLCVLAILALGSVARAGRILDHFDIDSLSYLSTAIVRARVGDAAPVKTEDGNFVVYSVTALDVFKGPIKSGASVRISGLDEYQRAPGMPGHADSWDPIQKGDIVYIFLTSSATWGSYAVKRHSDVQWSVIESGVRLLDDKAVYDFVQYAEGRPAPPPRRTVYCGLVVMTNITSPGSSSLSRPVFEAQLKASASVRTRMAARRATVWECM